MRGGGSGGGLGAFLLAGPLTNSGGGAGYGTVGLDGGTVDMGGAIYGIQELDPLFGGSGGAAGCVWSSDADVSGFGLASST